LICNSVFPNLERQTSSEFPTYSEFGVYEVQ
jgi:hypothetical protein